MTLGDYLIERRITIEEFGRRIGRSHTSVSRYVNGQRMPDRETMVRIVAETGGLVTPNDFYVSAPGDAAGDEGGSDGGVSCAPHAA